MSFPRAEPFGNMLCFHGRNWFILQVNQNLSIAGEFPLQRQLYQSMLAQSLYMKAVIEGQRASGTLGSLIWMYVPKPSFVMSDIVVKCVSDHVVLPLFVNIDIVMMNIFLC
jgi:hypothetical protein